MVGKCVDVSGERVLEQALDPDRWAVQSLHVLDDGGAALQHKRSPDCKACLIARALAQCGLYRQRSGEQGPRRCCCQ
jgi:hypothetical protein